MNPKIIFQVVHLTFDNVNVADVVSMSFHYESKILHNNGCVKVCIETACKTCIRRVKNNLNSTIARSCGRTVTLTTSNNKIMKKDGSRYRYFKRKKGVYYPSFVHIADEKQYIGQCFLANLNPLNKGHNSYFNILKDPN